MIEWHPKIPVIEMLIAGLYELDGCRSGGLCHVVTDDDNIDDDDLEFVIRECHKPENKRRIDVEVSSLICELLLQLTFSQRALLFTLLNMGYTNVAEEDWNLLQKGHDTEALVKEFKYEE